MKTLVPTARNIPPPSRILEKWHKEFAGRHMEYTPHFYLVNSHILKPHISERQQ